MLLLFDHCFQIIFYDANYENELNKKYGEKNINFIQQDFE